MNDNSVTPSGEPTSDMGLTASLNSKQPIYVVNHPLTPSEKQWLLQQKKRVAEVYQQSKSRQNPSQGNQFFGA